ncbi:DUF5047 domain-containing protein [Streptomyces beihaiensis]|uniref:DUF5047 domain-containing protein n=1 Tax=Streptomyces beihaiensis TaxID=2984495 RepID=A0ABT3U6E7_9ACTN|nr:DUF5047 domain-containing protein [Streptomyces beihaiensis]MCX3064197.1 DUF5047 domain-containing protein [Streptomyces beihaiensis]
MSAEALAIVQRGFTMAVRAESWLDGELLADDIPVADGSEDRDRSLNVPERVTLTVPRRDRGVDWDPRTVDHPLAAYGQQLRIDYGVDLGGGQTEWINRGWFLITDTSTDGNTVSVTAQGLLSLVDEAKFVAPFQPSSSDTLVSICRALVEPALTVTIDGTLTDRSVPLGMQWDDDRLGALTEVLDAWPADARVTEDGYLLIEPLTDTGTSVLDVTDDPSTGTVVQWRGAATRDGAFNVVVAQGELSDGTQIQGTAYDTDSNSPYRIGGPFSPLPVPYTMSSPLLTSVTECRSAASTTLARLRRTAYRKLDISMVPHPGLVTGDYVTVTGAGLTGSLCVIETMSLPYSTSEMTVTVRVLDG